MLLWRLTRVYMYAAPGRNASSCQDRGAAAVVVVVVVMWKRSVVSMF